MDIFRGTLKVLFFPLHVFFHFLDFGVFKILVASPVGLSRVPGFAVVIIGDPVPFDVMAGPALFGPSEIGSFIIRSNRPHMLGGIKIFVYVTTFTIFVDYIIIFCRVIFPIKSIFNSPLRAPCHDNHQKPDKGQTFDRFQRSCAHGVDQERRPRTGKKRSRLLISICI